MLERVRQNVRRLVNQATPRHIHANPFGKALDKPDDIVDELTRNAIRLNPLIKRHIIDGFEGVPGGFRLGWAQLPQTHGHAFSIGLFTDSDHFAQIALADGKARVFAGTDPDMDTQELEPRFVFVKEETLTLADGPRLGHAASGNPKTVRATQGGVVGRMPGGRMMWLASWLKTGSRYTLEQMRANLPAKYAVRPGIPGRHHHRLLRGLHASTDERPARRLRFTGNIFRRLNREAPMGAIRRSIRDTMSARSHGMRASGLEDYFADLMREAGALDTDQGLEAVHGAEPLHLYTSSYSGCYFFAWDSSLPFSAVLCALNIEGNLNRFAAVSSWLERNARIGTLPTEDTVTRAEAAQIDMALLENPALIALKPDDRVRRDPRLPKQDDGIQAVIRLVDIAADFRRYVAESTKDNVMEGDFGAEGGSEWVYRRTMSGCCAACVCHTVSTLTSGAASATAMWQSASLLLEFP